MSGQLEEVRSHRDLAEAELAKYQKHLEELVPLRTAELTQANTSLREINRQLADAHSLLLASERMSAIGQLAAGVAHEINNPVAFVNAHIVTASVKALLSGVNRLGLADSEGQRISWADVTDVHGAQHVAASPLDVVIGLAR